MIAYRLPKSVNIDGNEFPINSEGDYRMALDVISVLNDEALTMEERWYGALNIFYNFDVPQNQNAAALEIKKFIDCISADESEDANEDDSQQLKLMDWEQDFNILCDDINAKYGIDIRGVEYLHWWTFSSYYKCLGEGQFSTIVSIRKKIQKGEKLERWEQDFYNSNKKRIDIKGSMFNCEEEEFIEYILGG